MHVYEFDRRVLVGEKEITDAVSGRKLTHPRTNSRWTEELAPGLASFASLADEDLYPVRLPITYISIATLSRHRFFFSLNKHTCLFSFSTMIFPI